VYAALASTLLLGRGPLHRLRLRIDTGLARGGEVRLNITLAPANDQPGPNQAAVSVPYAIKLQAAVPRLSWRPPFVRTKHQVITGFSPPVNFEPYQKDRDRLPTQMQSSLAELQQRSGGQPPPVQLTLDVVAAPFPWEALLALALPGAPQPGAWRESFTFMRVTGSTTQAPGRMTPREARLGLPWNLPGQDLERGVIHLDPEAKLAAFAGPLWRGMVSAAWPSMSAAASGGGRVRFVEGGEDPHALGDLRLLHLVGQAVRTGGALRFEVGGEADGPAQTKASVRTGRILDGDELPVDRTGLIVVQGTPASDVSARFETDRQSMADLRDFAAQLFELGALRVIALPPLPPDLASQCLAIVSGAYLDLEEPEGGDLLRAAALLRALIAGWQPPVDSRARGPDARPEGSSGEVLLEKALDVTVFARTDLAVRQPPSRLSQAVRNLENA
jgi:hypothetical protein